jgi:fibro-slime domain-containing protein
MKTISLKAVILALFFAVCALAQSKTFYFLPPNEPDWIRMTPRIRYLADSRSVPMELALEYCGWYKATIASTDLSDDKIALIYQGANIPPPDQIGVKGVYEDSSTWVGGIMPEPIIFSQKFGSNSIISFNSTKGDEYGEGGWKVGTPDTIPVSRCSYSMAAIIYDTDASVNSSFFDYCCGTGIARGIPKPVLGTDTDASSPTFGLPKMQWNQSKDGWKEEDFKDAFRCSSKNAMTCYDMPFARDSKGLWTFNSDKLCQNGSVDLNGNCAGGGGYAWGFFPRALNEDLDITVSIDPRCDYNSCSDCRRPRKAESWVPFNNSISQTCYEVARPGTATTPSGCSSFAFSEGDFKNGDSPGIWDWGFKRPDEMSKNELFCFETHASFTYEEGQKFYFSGDDDIWIFINNRIVIDNGGTHLATPGYVDLDSIGKTGSRWESANKVSGAGASTEKYPELTKGKEYPLDIFFCDRRTTMSNVRISTNMYISQENGLKVKGDGGDGLKAPAEICMTTSGGGTCVAMMSGGGGAGKKEECGGDIANLIEYYVQDRRGDKKDLNKDNPECEWDAQTQVLTCYGGIKIDFVKGTVIVDRNRIDGLSGTQTVFVQVNEEQAKKMNPPPDPQPVVKFTAQTALRMIYGRIINDSNNQPIAGASDLCQQEYTAVTGELVPICISDATFDTKEGFVIEVDEVVGLPVRLATKDGIVGDKDKKATLQIYEDEEGTRKLNLNELTIPRSGPNRGVLVLWVTGGYEQIDNEFEYAINVQGRQGNEAVTLHSILPKLVWVKEDGTEIPESDSKGSKWENEVMMTESDGTPSPVWVRAPIKLTLEARNSVTGKLCDKCKFPLGYEAYAYRNNVDSDRYQQTDDNLIAFSGVAPPHGIIDGVAHIEIAGKRPVPTVEGDNDYAKITILGMSESQRAIWDKLRFKDPPVPYPDSSFLYDSDGDGIADSLVIFYSRGFQKDSLPNMIEVVWGKDTTLFGIGVKNAKGEYPHDGIDKAENLKYWKQFIRSGGKLEQRTTGNLDEFKGVVDTIVFTHNKGKSKTELFNEAGHFSEKVLTKGEGKLSSWASFTDPKTSQPFHLGSMDDIQERIPAIVISAVYLAGDDKGCGVPGNPCSDRITIEFSEPVFAMDANDIEARNPFAYMLRDIGDRDFKALGPTFLPRLMRFRSSSDIRPGSEGDTSVILTFDRWRDPSGNNSKTPMPGDSVKFANIEAKYGHGITKYVLRDAKGNVANLNEIGRQIEGRKPFTPDKVAIGELDPTSDNIKKDVGDVLANEIRSRDPNVINKMYTKDRPVEILPVRPEWSVRDVKEHYKGTVGMLFNPDIFNTLADLEDKYGLKIPDSAIVIYAKVFYHTNLGTYVADRNLSIKCDDDIFPPSEDPQKQGKASCRDNRNKIYVAWDMKDMNGRFVGTGAYVGLYDFHWEVNYYTISEKMEKIDRKVEMHGVKRVRRK